jgi:hypothetical protein
MTCPKQLDVTDENAGDGGGELCYNCEWEPWLDKVIGVCHERGVMLV